jgi:hypothetical protein
VDQVDGVVRARRVAARSSQDDLERVGGGGDRPGLEPDAADLERRVAVQAVDRRRLAQPALVEDVERAAGMSSSAGWKTSRTVPPRRSAAAARASPAPSTAVVCTSWPQAWQTPGTVER